tara:strand:- start:242 stop:2272 length:2031 start_codon:yes stop_codon:yes gene_type:complete
MIKRYERFAPRLSALGYDTTPLNGKVPLLKGWQGRPEGAKDFQAHSNANIGIVLGGAHNTIAVDIDVRNEMASGLIRGLAIDILGAAPERIGNAPKTMLIYQSAVATKKVKTAVYDVDGMDACVEILAEGQQFVASGVHPDTQKDYDWPGDTLLDYKPNDLPTITTDDMAEFLAAANTVLGNYGEIKAKSLSSPSQGNGKYDFATSPQEAEHDRILAALAYIPNDDSHYDDWAYMAHAIKGACGDGVPALDLFHRWSERSAKYDEAETDRMWKSIGTVNKIGAGTIFKLAADNGYPMGGEDNFGPGDLVQDRPEKYHEEDEFPEEAEIKPARRSFAAKSVIGPIPPREWLLADWFPARAVSMLGGAGGIGKSLIVQQMANSITLGLPIFGVEVKQMPCLFVGCEDDAPEVSRRQLAINEWLGRDFEGGPEDVALWPRVGEDNIIVTFGGDGKDEAGVFFEELCKEIEAVMGDAESICLFLDTVADLFGGNENSRRETNTFLKKYLGSIVVKYNATIILLAHPSIAGMQSGTGLSGSTGWENGVRARAYLHKLADDDADDDMRVLSRMKSNYSQSGEDHDIKVLYDSGAFVLPTTPEHFARLNNEQLKTDVVQEVRHAWETGNPYRDRKGRIARTALPAMLQQYKPAAVFKVFKTLVDEGKIIHIDRKGYMTEDGSM